MLFGEGAVCFIHQRHLVGTYTDSYCVRHLHTCHRQGMDCTSSCQQLPVGLCFDRYGDETCFIYFFVFIYLFFFYWVRLESTWYLPLTGLLYQPWVIGDECGTVGGMRIGRGNRSTCRKPAPVPLCPPQITHDLTWALTQAGAVARTDLENAVSYMPFLMLLSRILVTQQEVNGLQIR
jgi:hypothetical protein